jgi:hypothetical protein
MNSRRKTTVLRYRVHERGLESQNLNENTFPDARPATPNREFDAIASRRQPAVSL